jgi:hypothetical protein
VNVHTITAFVVERIVPLGVHGADRGMARYSTAVFQRNLRNSSNVVMRVMNDMRRGRAPHVLACILGVGGS